MFKAESDFGRDPDPSVHRGANGAGAAGPLQIGIGGKAGNTWGGAPIRPVPPDRAPCRARHGAGAKVDPELVLGEVPCRCDRGLHLDPWVDTRGMQACQQRPLP